VYETTEDTRVDFALVRRRLARELDRSVNHLFLDLPLP
jgi:hypothetical protein